MNDLLFYTLLIAVAYYSLVYLPSQKSPSLSPNPLTHSKSTQTDPLPKKSGLEPEAIPNPKDTEQLKNLQSQLTTLTQNQVQQTKTIQNLKTSEQKLKQQLTQLTQTQQQEQKNLETALDQLIKGINDLNRELD